MPRPKKDGIYVNFKIKSDINKRLCALSDKTGLSKTVIVEKALEQYFMLYDTNAHYEALPMSSLQNLE